MRPPSRCGTCHYWRPTSPATYTAGTQQGRCLAMQKPPFWSSQPLFPIVLASEGSYCAAWRASHVLHAA